MRGFRRAGSSEPHIRESGSTGGLCSCVGQWVSSAIVFGELARRDMREQIALSINRSREVVTVRGVRNSGCPRSAVV